MLPILMVNRSLYTALMALGEVPIASVVDWAIGQYATESHVNPQMASYDAARAVAAHRWVSPNGR